MATDDIKLIKEKERKEQELREIASSLGFSREFKIYFKEILNFHSEYGHFRIPIRHRTTDDLPLGKFMIKLRLEFNHWKAYQERSEKKQGAIHAIRRQRFIDSDIKMFQELESLDFQNSLINVKSEWDRGFEQLEEFYREHGHAYVKPRYKFGKSQFELGTWVTYQRVQRRKNTLDSEKINKLNNLNFLWTVDLEEILSPSNKVDTHIKDTKFNLMKLFNKTSNNKNYIRKVEIITEKRKELSKMNNEISLLQKDKQLKELRLKGFESLIKDVALREQSVKKKYSDEWLPHPKSSSEKIKHKNVYDETKKLRLSLKEQTTAISKNISEICAQIEKLDYKKHATLKDIEILNEQIHTLV